MRKLLTLLIMVFLITSGMAQETISLGARKTNDKQVSNAVKSQLPVTIVDPYDIRQVVKNNPIATKQAKSPVCVRSLPEKRAKTVIDIPEPIVPHPLAPMQGGENIATATIITSLPYNNTGTTSTYADNYNEVCPYTNTGGRDVVYRYTPAANGVIDITLCGDITNFDTKLYVYDTPTPVTGDAIACNDDLCSNALTDYISEITGVPVTAGVTYYIVVDGFSGVDFGTYEITVTNGVIYPVPANDNCTTATLVNGPFPQTVTGTTLGATVDCPGVLDWNAVWYAINLPNAVNDLTVDWCGTADMSTVGVVYYPTCPVVCDGYELYTTNIWSICGTVPDATTATTTFLGIPGPTTIYYPAYSIPQMDHTITFSVQAVVCPAPSALTVSDRTTTGAKLGWTAGNTESLWNVEVGLPGFVPGNGEYVLRGSPTVNLFSATPLSTETRYEFYVQADCGTDVSAWVGPMAFSTLIQCPGGSIIELEVCSDSTNNACNNVLPVNQTSENLTPGQTVCGTSYFDGSLRDTDWFTFTIPGPRNVTFSGKADFDLQLLLVSSPCPASVIAAGTALSGLTATVTYQLGAGTYYAWVGPLFNDIFVCGTANNYYATLTTTNVTAYCTPAPTSVDGLGITNVSFSTVNNPSGAETGNYGDYSALIGSAQRTTALTVNITYETGFTYDTKIWVDWNDDFLFTVDEEVYTGTSLSDDPTTLAANFVIPVAAPLGNHRMRIGGVDSGPPTPCYTGSYGSFEDYTLNVTAAPACAAPSAIVVSNILTTQVNLNWTENGTATLWNVKFGAPGFDPITQGTLRANVTKPYTLTGLTPATTYDVRVQAACGSTWSLPATFTTACVAISLPYSENFDAVTAPAIPTCMSVSDVNADAITWVTSTSLPNSAPNSMRISYNAALAMDDWFFTPAFSLTPGTYNVSFWYRNSGTTYPEALEVKWGTAPNAAGMTSAAIFNNSNITNTVYQEGTGVITITSAGTYYVGWHGYSNADMWYLNVDDISIVAASATKTLNLTNVRLEHLFVAGTGGMMNQAYNATGPQFTAPTADVITVELHDAANYGTILRTYTGVPLSQTGTASVTGIDLPDGNYRITIKHRNSIETTSASAVLFSGASVAYSFGTAASAFGNNLKLIDGFYCIIGGDVNQDGQVEGLDVTLIENGVNTFLKGYVPTDVDGSGDLGITDYTIWENNNNTFRKKIVPTP